METFFLSILRLGLEKLLSLRVILNKLELSKYNLKEPEWLPIFKYGNITRQIK